MTHGNVEGGVVVGAGVSVQVVIALAGAAVAGGGEAAPLELGHTLLGVLYYCIVLCIVLYYCNLVVI